MNAYIITGASRGLGEALAEQLLDEGNNVICISRTENDRLLKKAAELNGRLTFIACDLAQVERLEQLMRDVFAAIDRKSVSSLTLINNAGVLAPIKPVELCTADEIIRNTQINLTAPMILSASFLSLSAEWNVKKQIVNISSGAGRNPYFGWGNYCSAKAGLDMFTRCIAAEQSAKPYPVRAISFSPGVMDTGMQSEIRSASPEHFRDLERYISYKEQGLLRTPELVAKCIIETMNDEAISSGEWVDIKQRLARNES